METPTYQVRNSSTAIFSVFALFAMVAVHHPLLGYTEETAGFLSERIFYLALSWTIGKRALDLITKGRTSSQSPDPPSEFESEEGK